MKLENAAKQLEALGNPTRLSIYRTLIEAGKEGCPVGDIQSKLDVPASTLSHHIAKLVQCGLVSQERQSRTLVCKSDFGNMDDLMRFMLQNCCSKDSCMKATG